jgi:hypothetical protein
MQVLLALCVPIYLHMETYRFYLYLSSDKNTSIRLYSPVFREVPTVQYIPMYTCGRGCIFIVKLGEIKFKHTV